MNIHLECPGVGRDAENDKSLCFYFNRRVTDNEMRFLHEVLQRAAMLSHLSEPKLTVRFPIVAGTDVEAAS